MLQSLRRFIFDLLSDIEYKRKQMQTQNHFYEAEREKLIVEINALKREQVDYKDRFKRLQAGLLELYFKEST